MVPLKDNKNHCRYTHQSSHRQYHNNLQPSEGHSDTTARSRKGFKRNKYQQNQNSMCREIVLS